MHGLNFDPDQAQLFAKSSGKANRNSIYLLQFHREHNKETTYQTLESLEGEDKS